MLRMAPKSSKPGNRHLIAISISCAHHHTMNDSRYNVNRARLRNSPQWHLPRRYRGCLRPNIEWHDWVLSQRPELSTGVQHRLLSKRKELYYEHSADSKMLKFVMGPVR